VALAAKRIRFVAISANFNPCLVAHDEGLTETRFLKI